MEHSSGTNKETETGSQTSENLSLDKIYEIISFLN